MLCKYEALIIFLDNFERLLQLENSISVYDFSQGFCLPSSWCGQRRTEAGRQFLWVQVMAFISAQPPLSSQLINKKQIHQINLYEPQHHYATKEYNGHKAGSQRERERSLKPLAAVCGGFSSPGWGGDRRQQPTWPFVLQDGEIKSWGGGQGPQPHYRTVPTLP